MHDWLEYIESLHPEEIELGLDRVRRIFQNLQLKFENTHFVTIAGTNGKGSTLAFLESICLAAGYRVGSYTSPHLLRYNERVRIDGQDVSDDDLCKSFAKVEAARGDVELTYFEFGTLAALELFAAAAPDIVLLETGLGGRLDAVNIIDADVAVITSIDMDHMEWLGNTREQIGREKAGIFRASRAAICGDPLPPESVAEVANKIGAKLLVLGVDFIFEKEKATWHWQGQGEHLEHLPNPGLEGEHQYKNASAALATIEQLDPGFHVEREAIEQGLRFPRLPGRLETVAIKPQILVDVSHNPQAMRALAQYLVARPVRGQTYAILGMMRDKDIEKSLEPMIGLVHQWCVIDLPGPRGATSGRLESALRHLNAKEPIRCFADAAMALQHSRSHAGSEDRIVVFGSFVTVSAIMAQLQPR